MFRIVSALVLVATAVSLAAALAQRDPAPAYACSYAPATFEGDVRSASYVVVGDVIDVGRAANEQPPIPSPTATATVTPLPSSTPAVSPTRTPHNFRSPTPEDTELAAPSNTPAPSATPVDLTGYRAVLRPRLTYAGPSVASIEIDRQSRVTYENQLRRVEAGLPLTSCGLTPPFRYTLGGEYFVMLSESGVPPYTVFAVPVENDFAIFPANSGLTMNRSTYARFFAGFPAQDESDTSMVFVHIDRISLAQLGAAVSGVRNGVLPPDTGSGGMASGRR